MQIRIPRIVVRLWDDFGVWGNTPVRRFGRYEMLRLDIAIAIGSIPCIAWSTVMTDPHWLGFVQGALLYVFICMIGLWFF